MSYSPISEILASLKWEEKIDFDSLPTDTSREDIHTKLQNILVDLRKMNLKEASTIDLRDYLTYRIVPSRRRNTSLSDIGSDFANTRFNYRDSDSESGGPIKCRVLYFGREDLTAFVERFQEDSIFDDPNWAPEEHEIFTISVTLNNVLQLNTESTANMAGIPLSIIRNDWKDYNVNYNIPSSKSIIRVCCKKIWI